MGKIILIKEDQIIQGGSNVPIYPITSAKATYYKDGKHILKKIEETESGDILKDASIITRHIKSKNVTSDKLADESVRLNSLGNDVKGFVTCLTGTANFTWIKFAENILGANMSDIYTGLEYIGIAPNMPTLESSNNPLDYKWSRFKGDSPYSVLIFSENGNFRLGARPIVLYCKIYYGPVDVTDRIEDSLVSWLRVGSYSEEDIEWNNAHKGCGKTITITSDDTYKVTMFEVEVDINN